MSFHYALPLRGALKRDISIELARGHFQKVATNLEFEASPDFEPIRQRLLAIMDSKERIPYVAKHGRYYYNFWRDAKNVRGLWRRTTLAEFKKVEPVWETVVDMDKLSDAEKENWVWKGY